MDRSVTAPSLPINMIRMITSLLPSHRSGVIPVESPTVPNAETTSNRTCIKLYCGSMTQSRKLPTHTTDIDKSVMMEALATVPLEIALRNAPTCFLLNMALASWIRTKNVVVLIPPPVDPGDAPINISTQSTNSPALVKLPMGYVENPAVLADTLWKRRPAR